MRRFFNIQLSFRSAFHLICFFDLIPISEFGRGLERVTLSAWPRSVIGLTWPWRNAWLCYNHRYENAPLLTFFACISSNELNDFVICSLSGYNRAPTFLKSRNESQFANPWLFDNWMLNGILRNKPLNATQSTRDVVPIGHSCIWPQGGCKWTTGRGMSYPRHRIVKCLINDLCRRVLPSAYILPVRRKLPRTCNPISQRCAREERKGNRHVNSVLLFGFGLKIYIYKKK